MIERVPINLGEPVRVGDVLYLTWRLPGPAWNWWRATYQAYIEATAGRVLERQGVKVQLGGSVIYGDNFDTLTYRVTVLELPSKPGPQTVMIDGVEYPVQEAGIIQAALVVAAVTAVVGAVTWLTLDKVERAVSTPAGKALSFGFLLVAAGALFLILKGSISGKTT